MKQGYVVKATIYFGEDSWSDKLQDVSLFETKVAAYKLKENFGGEIIRVVRPPRREPRKRCCKTRRRNKSNQLWMKNGGKKIR